ncbi:ABC transporter ATP-binding protein [Amphritea balenae]|uniref:ABC transporter ATP-binding protein n=1 Tax=Amphritea balenae TaxID=452629 RepID=A0A3P1SJD8_9GAMM|nr:ABC transporter ATP-binding protein [Amphritea balenae]RRC97080.1 ABC transporter ATP-binding protein [Amphritea balenae]GGK67790.1 multidrug ABC transporter ATP-binding protein [Amphritea balenae]
MFRWLSAAIDGQDRGRLEDAFRWLYTFVKPQSKAIIGLMLLSVFGSAMVLLQPWLTKMLIDDGLLAKDYGMLVTMAIAMILVGIASTALSGINRYLHTRLSGKILFSLREHLYEHLQTLSPQFYGGRRIGDILSRLDGDVSQIQRFAVDSMFSALSSVLGLVGALVLLVTLSWQLSLLVLVLIPLEVLWLRWMRRKVERQTRVIRERSADLSSFLVETLPAMKFIQSVSQEKRESRKLNKLSDSYLTDLLKLQVTEFFTQAIPGTLTSLTRATAFLIGGYWVIEGQWQLGSLIAFSTYLGMATGPVQSLLGLYVAIQRMSVSLDRVMDLRRAAPDIEMPEVPVVLPQELKGEIRFERVSFSYEQREDPILSQTSVQFPPGMSIALTGPSGVGKSTVIDLLMRYYDPDHGRITIDDIDLKTLAPMALRKRVALVSQDITLFRGSLAENIRYAAPDATDDQINDAVKQAQLTELVESLPLGLDTPLGERGSQLSGGQKQRVAIARAILQKPVILILDEATSAVDEATEAEVIANVNRVFADRTRILISHRASTLANADVRIALTDGQLISENPLPEAG